jgi:nicotinamide mononucleotide (NMN) deamidase PncC
LRHYRQHAWLDDKRRGNDNRRRGLCALGDTSLTSGSIANFVQPIHNAPGTLVLCVTGGGSRAISSLLEAPGASRTVLEAAVPYCTDALVRWLHARPEQFCSEATARAMAMSAYLRAREYDAGDGAVAIAGVGCTCSLASDRAKHGPHRIHAALQTVDMTLAHSVELLKGKRTREVEEAVAAAMILNLVAEFKKLTQRVECGLLTGEDLQVSRTLAPPEWQRLLSGSERLAASGVPPGTANTASFSGRVIFPGAFHPRHDGHREMARLAAERTGRTVEHELSIVNVDKPPLDFIEMERRAAQFAANEPLWFTRAATFVEKAELFPHATWVVGTDTVVRIADAKYYGGEQARDAALAALAAAGCRFLVFGRCHDGAFHSLCDLALPAALRRLCDEVPGHAFRVDVSSTSLRQSIGN